MPHETQTIEYKPSWRDEWLKWICGFANAQGGVLEVGKNDDGEVVGLDDARRLLEEIPNKLVSTMAIMADVDLHWDGPRAYISITVQPYPNPISYHGKYYVRMGATNRELTGNALQEFLLRKLGRTWDSVPLPRIQLSDLDSAALQGFRRMAVARQRLTEAEVNISDAALINSLRLDEGEYLTRAAALLFHQDPERWFTGCYVKIGRFLTGAQLRYQDEVHGPLITLTDTVVNLTYTKYMEAVISYEGIYRRETYPVPDAAFREAILNAIVHTDYSSGMPIQIKVLPDRIIISNAGKLPENLTLEGLVSDHASIPHNPDVAGVFFRSGQVEAWGRGIAQMLEACAKADVPPPSFMATGATFDVTFMFSQSYLKTRYAVEPAVGARRDMESAGGSVAGDGFSTTPSVAGNVVEGVVGITHITSVQQLILRHMKKNATVTAAALARIVGITPRRIQANIKALKDAGLVTRVGPDKGGHWVVSQGVRDA